MIRRNFIKNSGYSLGAVVLVSTSGSSSAVTSQECLTRCSIVPPGDGNYTGHHSAQGTGNLYSFWFVATNAISIQALACGVDVGKTCGFYAVLRARQKPAIEDGDGRQEYGRELISVAGSDCPPTAHNAITSSIPAGTQSLTFTSNPIPAQMDDFDVSIECENEWN